MLEAGKETTGVGLTFEVDERALTGFAELLARAKSDVDEALRYTHANTSIPDSSQGLFTRLFSLHDSLAATVDSTLRRLSTVVSESSSEMARCAEFYRGTDLGEAARMDATYPASRR
ncbi:hypothetical protein [Allostreptomyces psammosilenae]|uniref:Uncharacterized protein n=1 Tax=Allostreptomyces psammosilenae TaxID=1892865 RepID=A0A853A721_9ACTN|nr:hypothetical protein [Allostreptomyces psammosilenae]NYI06471.1 hypothetical protein [Allostreptomyces psammosilenae]